jgi:hypothetical protein
MNTNGHDEIPKLLAKWLQLTEEEHEAIQAGSWTDLEQIQFAKKNLRPLISAAMEADSKNSSLERNTLCFQADFKRLIAMESRNRELLTERMETAAETKDSLKRSAHNLRRIHRSYAQKPETAWHSYS